MHATGDKLLIKRSDFEFGVRGESLRSVSECAEMSESTKDMIEDRTSGDEGGFCEGFGVMVLCDEWRAKRAKISVFFISASVASQKKCIVDMNTSLHSSRDREVHRDVDSVVS